ncbi:hypothetical protein HanHA300_Chr14g0516251 [Helianthus annuus]|nr:hypothetical protein HanHA300_Chr14g0516251 [Helianthus annuus]
MCDIITDSVVLGFFIEAEKILSVLGIDDAVDDFLWQESSIILSKLLVLQSRKSLRKWRCMTYGLLWQKDQL